jgi:hypothetical protein
MGRGRGAMGRGCSWGRHGQGWCLLRVCSVLSAAMLGRRKEKREKRKGEGKGKKEKKRKEKINEKKFQTWKFLERKIKDNL